MQASTDELVESFCAADAVERLHAAILRVDTLARVAERAVDEFRCLLPPEAARELARLQILVTRTTEEAGCALAEGDRLMAALIRQLAGNSAVGH